MKILETLLKSKLFILALLIVPAILIVVEGFNGGFMANPVEFILLETGDVAAKLLLISLWISPLRLLFPKASWVKLIMRHRRMIGVTCFVYGLGHVIIYALGSDGLAAILEDLTRPFILSGSVGFLILLVLTITSTNRAIKRLGGKKWKVLHRFVYLAAALIFLHMVLKEKSNVLETLLLFVPLALVQVYRFWKTKVPRLQKPNKTSSYGSVPTD